MLNTIYSSYENCQILSPVVDFDVVEVHVSCFFYLEHHDEKSYSHYGQIGKSEYYGQVHGSRDHGDHVVEYHIEAHAHHSEELHGAYNRTSHFSRRGFRRDDEEEHIGNGPESRDGESVCESRDIRADGVHASVGEYSEAYRCPKTKYKGSFLFTKGINVNLLLLKKSFH